MRPAIATMAATLHFTLTEIESMPIPKFMDYLNITNQMNRPPDA